MIGLFHGKCKPKNPTEYLGDFVAEAQELLQDGLLHERKQYQVSIAAFVCDAPARSFLKQVKQHNGYHSCEKCSQPGEWHHDERRMAYPEMNARLRTDASFNSRTDEDHHIAESPLSVLPIGLVSQFPLDYMHLVCLGVVRRLISLWVDGPLQVRMPHNVRVSISEHLESLQHYTPVDFARKPRSLFERSRWKATECRLFLLYTGPLVLKDNLPSELYQNFMLLSSAIRILAHPCLCYEFADFAKTLLVQFVEHFAELYGSDQVVYNIHNLVHLPDDCKVHGHLDSFSSFPFENFLGQMKRLIRKQNQVMSQVIRRLAEMSKADKKRVSSAPLLSQEHFRGPLLSDMCAFVPVHQFKKLSLKSCTVGINQGDCCVKINGIVCVVKNILSTSQGSQVIFSEFLQTDSFFAYPFDSSRIGVFKVSHLSNELKIASSRDIQLKYALFPSSGKYVAFPILHTSV